ncbi:MAG: CHASE2 domain-containing protein [Hyphomicrobium sp.]
MSIVLMLILLLRIYDPSPIAKLRLTAFDTLQSHFPRVPDSTFPIKVIDIDEVSLEKLGQWPWPRHRLATLIERLKEYKAQTITLDILLAEPDRWSPENILQEIKQNPAFIPSLQNIPSLVSNDVELAQAFADTKVVLGFTGENNDTQVIDPPRASYAISGDDPTLFLPKFLGGIGALDVLYNAAQGYGALNWIPEFDQVVRRIPLLVTVKGKIYPSLALETLRVASTENPTLFIRSSGGSGIFSFGAKTGLESVTVQSRTLITNQKGELWLKFSPPQKQRTLSAWELLSDHFDRNDIEGRHILIGSSATGLSDLHATPLSSSVPGVEIHAEALEQMLSGDYLIRPGWAKGAELFYIFFVSLGLSYFIPRMRVSTSLLVCFLCLLGAVSLAFFFYQKKSFLIDPIYPSLSILIVYLGGSFLSYLRAEREKAQIRAAFGYYVSPSVVRELTRNPEKLKLGGETRDVSLLFADIRNFSSLSEGMEAESLLQFINKIFSPIAENILNFEGTIDKFMGDAVMAFWNAPLFSPQHAAQACRAALAMQKTLGDLNAQAPSPTQKISLGIGINTGACVVGNVGSPQRFDYSVLGDVVNSASRLEEMTKNFGVPILISETTAQAVKNFTLVDLGSYSLRGRERKENLYALLGDECLSAHPRILDFKTHFRAYAYAMLQGDRSNAQQHLLGCQTCAIEAAQIILHASAQRLQL